MSFIGNRKILHAKRRKPENAQTAGNSKNVCPTKVEDVESCEDLQKNPKRIKFTHSATTHASHKSDKSISRCQANARLKRLRHSLEVSKHDSEVDESYERLSDTPRHSSKKFKTSTPLQERLTRKKISSNLSVSTNKKRDESGINIFENSKDIDKQTTLSNLAKAGPSTSNEELNNNKSLYRTISLTNIHSLECDKSFVNESEISKTSLNNCQSIISNDLNENMDVMEWTQECNDVSVAQATVTAPPNNSQLLNSFNDENPKLSKSDDTYVVVDTNIFIENLQTIMNILHISYEDSSSPVIYVPWMVIQELDYFKDGYSVSEKYPMSKDLQRTARRAVKFINECLISRRKNFKGQSVRDAADDKLKHLGPDDSILSCCFQVAEKCNVILLSADTNLRNKALINNISTYPPDRIISVLKKNGVVKEKNIKEKVFSTMALLCSFIIYSEKGRKEEIQNMPWEYQKCISYLKINFGTILKPFVQKQCRKVIDDIYEILSSGNGVLDEKVFVNLNLSMLIYMKTGLKKYERNIQKTIQEIQDIEKLI